jgi:excisionase family DNA binding protein
MFELTLAAEPFLNSDQAAAILRIHPKTLQRLARHGHVIGYRVGKLWRFHVRPRRPQRWLRVHTRRRHCPAVRFKYHSCPQLTRRNPCLFGHGFNMAVCG